VNDDVAASDRLIGAVVIHREARALVPNLDSERVGGGPALAGTVFARQEESVVPAVVDRAGSLELRLRSCDDQPLIGGAVEVEVAGAECKLRLAGRDCRVLLVLRHEPEVGFALGVRAQRRQGAKARARLNPATARHKAPRRVIHDEIAAGERAEVELGIGSRARTGRRLLGRGVRPRGRRRPRPAPDRTRSWSDRSSP